MSAGLSVSHTDAQPIPDKPGEMTDAKTAMTGTGMGYGSKSGHNSSTTYSGISSADIHITDAAADSYAKRYLVKDIFNLAIGEGDNDGNGNQVQRIAPERVRDFCERLGKAENEQQLRNIFRAAYTEAEQISDRVAQKAYIDAKDARKRVIL